MVEWLGKGLRVPTLDLERVCDAVAEDVAVFEKETDTDWLMLFVLVGVDVAVAENE